MTTALTCPDIDAYEARGWTDFRIGLELGREHGSLAPVVAAFAEAGWDAFRIFDACDLPHLGSQADVLDLLLCEHGWPMDALLYELHEGGLDGAEVGRMLAGHYLPKNGSAWLETSFESAVADVILDMDGPLCADRTAWLFAVASGMSYSSSAAEMLLATVDRSRRNDALRIILASEDRGYVVPLLRKAGADMGAVVRLMLAEGWTVSNIMEAWTGRKIAKPRPLEVWPFRAEARDDGKLAAYANNVAATRRGRPTTTERAKDLVEFCGAKDGRYGGLVMTRAAFDCARRLWDLGWTVHGYIGVDRILYGKASPPDAPDVPYTYIEAKKIVSPPKTKRVRKAVAASR